ncbi:MAG TPA: protein translocase subunit SecF [Ilumatobacter sp.]|nr:protein translocase subunit SecF [Ilumatobacter sp.]
MRTSDVLATEPTPPLVASVRTTRWGRLVDSQTAFDFIGARKWGFLLSAVLLIATVISLWAQGLNLGIDFEGGVSWDVPAQNFSIDDAHNLLEENGISAEGARIQQRQSEATDFIKVQVADQPEQVGTEMRDRFAEAAGVDPDEINVNLVSSSWGSEITEKAIRALVIFLALVAVFISIRFEWRMAIAAILAMIHDVIVSVGIYSIFQFLVTPPTVIAFLTILGYSLYDTIVVFDRVRENETRFLSQKPPYEDVINVSMNQVLMRSLMTTFSSVIPVLSMLVVGAWIMGQTTLEEFGLALFIGLITGAYSSLFVAAPLLGYLKKTDANWKSRTQPRATGEALREMVITGHIANTRRVRPRASMVATANEGGVAVDPVGVGPADTHEQATTLLSHPPRPRKKTRR